MAVQDFGLDLDHEQRAGLSMMDGVSSSALEEDGMELRERLDRAEWERQQARGILRRLRGAGHSLETEERVEREVEDEIEEIEDSLRQQTQTGLAQKARTHSLSAA
jgi:hypothetical protein